ncbi:hypothetical protein HPB50_025905 [Hyalomma asiaticum]|uniref:Uncharacterized protein n=1 Tax=Hyalomma asiaticum TaxID=266040 RepID=A0ACB7RRS9_HYAAI|nr:hypothetical protein HPB50_025905 [Hyalomma asiaticum]
MHTLTIIIITTGEEEPPNTMARPSAKVLRFQTPEEKTDNRSTQELWQELEKGFKKVQEEQSYSPSFDELYHCVYAMVRRKEGQRLYHGLQETIGKHLANNVRPHVLAEPDHKFLRALNAAWKKHQTSMSMIGDVVAYLDCTYASRDNCDSVSRTGTSLFRDEVVCYADVRDRLRATLLDLVDTERRGGSVDRLEMKQACNMLMVSGLGSRSVYEEIFERSFLAELARFYSLRGQNCAETMNALEYVDAVERHIDEESERARQCLDESTVVAVERFLAKELLGERMKAVLEKVDFGIEHMLKNGMTESLARTLRLLKRTQDGPKVLLECASKHLRDMGRSMASGDRDSMNLIPKLVDLKRSFDDFLRHSFKNDYSAEQTIAADFEYILGLSPRAPEQLAAYVSEMLHGIKRMTDQEIDQFLNEFAAIFLLLPDKESFESSYAQHLGKRLLLSKSTSYDDFKDAVSSCRMDLKNVDLNSARADDGIHTTIPHEASNAFETFRRFYLAKHRGRQLNLQPHLGWADVNAVFYGPWNHQPRTYTIQVSTFQMYVLMLFNSHDKLTYGDIASETKIPEKDLLRALNSLCSGEASRPILVKAPGTQQIENSHVFAVNEAFTSVMARVKVLSTTGQTNPASTDAEAVNVDEEQRYTIEAAIVRVMKARKKLSHNDLVTEVTDLLRDRFTPSRAALKRRVDALIDKMYLERDNGDREVYVYVS